MAATVIDELVVKLGLDPKQFTEGQRKVIEESKKTVENLRKHGRDIEDSTKKSINDFGLLAKSMLEFTGIAVGATEIRDYVRQTANMGLELGRTSMILGTTTSMLSTWQNAAVLTGGTVAGMTNSIRALTGSMLDLSLTGNTSAIPLMASIGMRPVFNKNGVLDYDQTILNSATYIQKNHIDKAHAAYVLGMLGQDDATTALILSGPENIRKKKELAHEYAPSTEDVKDLTDLANAWNVLDLAMTAFGRDLVLAPWRDWTTLLAGLNPGVLGSFIGHEIIKHAPGVPKRVSKDNPASLALFAPKQLLAATAGEVTGFFGPASPTGGIPAAPGTVGATDVDHAAWAAAVAAQQQYGIPAAVTYAQWALESGHGAHMPAGSNNPFGIKARGSQPFVSAWTHEMVHGKMVRVKAHFRKFSSIAAAFAEHARLLAQGKRYAGARAHEDDPDAFADALTGVYATDQGYGRKLKDIMHSKRVQQLAHDSGATVIHNDVHIGQIVVNSQATDANGVAQDISPAVKRNLLASLANSGQQ